MIQESPSFIWNLLKMIGNVFKISASATAIHPTKIPAQKPYTYKSQCPTGRLISVNTDIIVPKIPPSTIIFSKRMVFSARLHFAIILGTTPMTVINAKVPAATPTPEASPINPRNKCLIHINTVSSSLCVIDESGIQICLIFPHLDLDRCRIMRDFLVSYMVEKHNNPNG